MSHPVPRITASACLVALFASLAACGGGNDDPTTPAPNPAPAPAPGPAPAPATDTTLVTFNEATAPRLVGFGNVDASVIVDPTDSTNKVAQVVKPVNAELWAGATVAICPNDAVVALPFSASNTQLTARVWSPDANIPVRMKVENAADGTQSVETEATVTTAAGWQTLTFNFANHATGTAALDLTKTYNKVSVFFNFGAGNGGTALPGARIYYLDDLKFAGNVFSVACPAASTPTSVITFSEATPPTLTPFGNQTAAVVTDPTDAANKVAQIDKPTNAELWAGTTVSNLANFAVPTIAFAAGKTSLTARVWSPDAGIPVRMKVEDAANGGVSVETEATVTTASGWQTLTFNFANQAAGTAALDLTKTYNKVSVFFNFGAGNGGAPLSAAKTYYLDDLNLVP